ncbi:transcriptional regulator with XRE-family HTH domain [Alkalibacillus flavidus]|uniref:Transcriptional regulator with XRE-family HTH domain n=1 Tax=Alkalibacillus flavidus TaxID=546021 RepID=A0ABV2L0K1_9BACI
MSIKRFNHELFAETLKEYLGEQPRSVIAEKLNTSRVAVLLWENQKQEPTLDELQLFCETLNVSTDTFFYEEPEDTTSQLKKLVKSTDKQNLEEVLNRIKIREKYIAIENRKYE